MRTSAFQRFSMATAALLVSVGAHAQSQDFKGMTLTVLGVNSDLNALYMSTYGKAFEQETGAKLVIVTGSSSDNLSKALVAKGRTPSFQVLALENPTQAQAILAGAIQKQDYTQMPHTKDLAPGAVPTAGYGPAYDFFRFGTCVNTAQYSAHHVALPTGIDGWFDPAIVGHAILPSPSNFWWTTGMQALADHFNVSLDNPAPLFDKLKAMKPISLYTASGQAQAMLQSGAAWMAPTSDGRCFALKSAGQPVDFIPLNLTIDGKHYPWVVGVDTWEIPTGLKGKPLALAYKFIDMSLDVPSALAAVKKFGFEPTTVEGLKQAIALPEAKKVNMYGPNFSFDQMYTPNPQKLLPVMSKWIALWNETFVQ